MSDQSGQPKPNLNPNPSDNSRSSIVPIRSSSSGATKKKNSLKKFTFKQIQEKVAERWEIPEYYDILMEASVRELEDGVEFNLKHPSFQKLIKLVKEHDLKLLDRKRNQKTNKRNSKNNNSHHNSALNTNTNMHLKIKGQARKRKSKNTIIKVKPKVRKNKKVKSQQQWLDILTEQLSCVSPNCKIVRDACKHVGIPVNLRATIWKILLNVPSKKSKLLNSNREHDSTHDSHSNANANATPDPGSGATPATATPFGELRDDPPPLYNQRVIQADIERTRPTMKCFQSATVRREMEIILTEYCHRTKVSYKQGMNYVLAPFFMIDMKDRLDIYLCFESFIHAYLNSTFNDEEFGSLQCIFRMFRLLIQYHDPELSVFLDFHEIMPELFASGWFMTIHANKSSQATLLHLWDEILLTWTNPCFHYFVDFELLRFNRDEILKKASEELPQFLVNFVIEDRDHARRLLKDAQKTSSLTPISFHELLRKCCQQNIKVDSLDYMRLEKLACASVNERELIGYCYAEQLTNNSANANSFLSVTSSAKHQQNGYHNNNNSAANATTAHDNGNGNGSKKIASTGPPLQPPPKIPAEQRRYSRKVKKSLKQSAKYAEQKQLKFFILDCRPLEQYENGHLPCAFHLDPKLELSSEKLRSKLMSLLSMKGCHFVLFFDGRHNSRSEHLLLNQNDPLALLNHHHRENTHANNSYSGSEGMLEHGSHHNSNNMSYNEEQQLLRQSYLYFFLDKRVKYISICENGFAGCHELIVGNLELIDHNMHKCLECNGKWKNFSLLSSVKGRFNHLLKNSLQVAGGSVYKLRNKMMEAEEEHIAHNSHKRKRKHHHSNSNHNPHTHHSNSSHSGSGTHSNHHNDAHDGSIKDATNAQKSTSDETDDIDEDMYPFYGNQCDFLIENNNCGRESQPKQYKLFAHWRQYYQRVFLCSNEPLLMIYLSIVRNRETSNQHFQDCILKILVLMFNQVFNYYFCAQNTNQKMLKKAKKSLHKMIKSKMNQNHNSNHANQSAANTKTNINLNFTAVHSYTTPSDLQFDSLISNRGIYGVCLDDNCEHALRHVLRSFDGVLSCVVGQLKVEESFTQDSDGILRSNRQAVALMPKDIELRIVIVFYPVLNSNQLHSAIDALLKLGAKETNIVIMCIIATPNCLQSLIDRFKSINVWTAAIDSLTDGGRINPGIGSFRARYTKKNSKMKKHKKKKKVETRVETSHTTAM